MGCPSPRAALPAAALALLSAASAAAPGAAGPAPPGPERCPAQRTRPADAPSVVDPPSFLQARSFIGVLHNPPWDEDRFGPRGAPLPAVFANAPATVPSALMAAEAALEKAPPEALRMVAAEGARRRAEAPIWGATVAAAPPQPELPWTALDTSALAADPAAAAVVNRVLPALGAREPVTTTVAATDVFFSRTASHGQPQPQVPLLGQRVRDVALSVESTRTPAIALVAPPHRPPGVAVPALTEASRAGQPATSESALEAAPPEAVRMVAVEGARRRVAAPIGGATVADAMPDVLDSHVARAAPTARETSSLSPVPIAAALPVQGGRNVAFSADKAHTLASAPVPPPHGPSGVAAPVSTEETLAASNASAMQVRRHDGLHSSGVVLPMVATHMASDSAAPDANPGPHQSLAQELPMGSKPVAVADQLDPRQLGIAPSRPGFHLGSSVKHAIGIAACLVGLVITIAWLVSPDIVEDTQAREIRGRPDIAVATGYSRAAQNAADEASNRHVADSYADAARRPHVAAVDMTAYEKAMLRVATGQDKLRRSTG